MSFPVTPDEINKAIENGTLGMSPDDAMKLLKALGISVSPGGGLYTLHGVPVILHGPDFQAGKHYHTAEAGSSWASDHEPDLKPAVPVTSTPAPTRTVVTGTVTGNGGCAGGYWTDVTVRVNTRSALHLPVGTKVTVLVKESAEEVPL